MIASKRQRAKHGTGRASGWLVVDGTDETIARKATIAFKPRSDRQRAKLLHALACTQETYNAALQERRDAYRHPSKTSLGLFDQFTALTTVREDRPDVFAYGIQPLRWALRRVDEAFSAFYARAALGQTPGYPRFKSRARFDTLGYDETTSWKLDLDRATLYVQGVGDIPLTRAAVRQFRRLVDRGGVPKTLTLTRANREGTAWRAAIAFTGITANRLPDSDDADALVGVDRGVVVPAALSTGDLLEFPADVAARLEQLRACIEDLQRERAAKKKYSRSWRHLSKKIRRLHSKATNITDNWARHTAKALVAAHADIAVEDLHLVAMTKSAKGTIETPGVNVAAKAGLNRSLAEVAPGKLARLIAVKAEDAGRRMWAVPAQYTSQECSACHVIDAASRITRDVYYCAACGHYAHADINAALVVAYRGQCAKDAWEQAGRAALIRPKPRLRRRKDPDLPAAA